MQKILLDDTGLQYICATAERFFAVSTVMANMVRSLVDSPSHRLLKHTIRCYLRLAENTKARDALRQCLPDELRDSTFAATLKADPSVLKWLQQLLRLVFPDIMPSMPSGATPGGATGGPMTGPAGGLGGLK